MARINVDINETEILIFIRKYWKRYSKTIRQDGISFGQRIRMHIEEMDFSIVMP